MKLFLIWQESDNGYDTYDSAVVCAKDEAEAKTIHPANGENIETTSYGAWVKDTASVYAKYIGTAARGTKQGVICASFNAG